MSYMGYGLSVVIIWVWVMKFIGTRSYRVKQLKGLHELHIIVIKGD